MASGEGAAMSRDEIGWLTNYIVRMVMVILLTVIAATTCANNEQLNAIRKAVESAKAAGR